MNYTDLVVVGFCGLGFLMAVWMKQTELANTIAVGLLGYLGGKVVR